MDEGFWMNLQEPFSILHPYYSLFCSENQVLFQLFFVLARLLACLLARLLARSLARLLFILHTYYSNSFKENQAFSAEFLLDFYIKSSGGFYLFYHLFEYYYTTLMQ